MPIKGLTDKETRKPKTHSHDTLGVVAIEIAKGQRKPESGIGRDLETKYRITTSHPLAVPILNQYYGQPNAQGDWIVDRIRFYFPYNDSDRNCPTSMVAFTKSQFVLECDRETIYKKTITETDNQFGVYRSIKDVNEPCPMAGQHLAKPCKYKCVKQAKLYIYIKEIFDAGYMLPAELEFHGFEDMDTSTGILAQMDKWKEQFGTVTESPFVREISHPLHVGLTVNSKHIPFILTRSKVTIKKPSDKKGEKRSGNNYAAPTWKIECNPDPDWVIALAIWKRNQEAAEQVRRAGFRLRSTAVAGLLRSDTAFNPNDVVLDVEATEIESEPIQESEPEDKPWMPTSKEDKPLTDEQKLLLRNVFKERWKGDAVNEMLQQKFGIHLDQGGLMMNSQYQQLWVIASDPEEAKYWNELVDF
jgi:hypothetical protein